MNTERLISRILFFSFVSILVASCTKDKLFCDGYTELTDRNHLVDIQPIYEVPEFKDTLTKYPQLQVFRVIDNKYMIGMHCNIFYKDLKVFSDQYSLFKSKNDGSVDQMNGSITDTIPLDLTPTLSASEAIKTAKQKMNFHNLCISYRLGITDINSGRGNVPSDYKLVWKVQGKGGNPYVILDANSGEVYQKDDGVRETY